MRCTVLGSTLGRRLAHAHAARVVISAVAENDVRYVVQSGGVANGAPERWELHAHVPLLIASCAPCDGPDGLSTGNGSAGITVAESASAAATIAADFIRRLSPYYLRRQLLANAGIAASRAQLIRSPRPRGRGARHSRDGIYRCGPERRNSRSARNTLL